MALETLFGDKVLAKDGEKPTSEALAGKTAIVKYFADWGCALRDNILLRDATTGVDLPLTGSQLAEVYTLTWAAKGMAIVFATTDQDEQYFNQVQSAMP